MGSKRFRRLHTGTVTVLLVLALCTLLLVMKPTPKELRAFAADPGSWNVIQPVLDQALMHGVHVSVHFSGAMARHFLSGQKLHAPVDKRISVTTGKFSPEFVSDPHAACVLGSSASLEGTEVAIKAICASVAPRIVLVEDYYGSSAGTLIGVAVRCPERTRTGLEVCFANDFSLGVARDNAGWKGASVVTGNPLYDCLERGSVGARQAQRREARAKLEVAEDALVALT